METKVEVVKTLVAYPLVLDKLSLTENLLQSSNELNSLCNDKSALKDEKINNLGLQIYNLEKEKQLFKIKLQRQKVKSVKIGAVGLLGTILAALLVK